MKKTHFLALATAALALASALIPQVAQAVQHVVAFVGPDNLAMLSLAGTTLAANAPRAFELGNRNEFPVIASDIIYEGGAIGLVSGTGHARPLTSVDRFAGFAEARADNSAGAAAAINVRAIESGKIELTITGAVITDVGQPVYATDDNAFTFIPTGAVFVGFVHRFVSAGIAVIAFDALKYQDPYAAYTVRETLSVNKTLDIEDNGKVFFVDTDAVVVTLPVVATPVNCKIVNIAAFGAAKVSIDPAAADKVQGPDLPGTDNKDLINTKATARRGDFVVLGTGDANGALVRELRGIWATEA
ncbi:MAG: hypothetical protein Q7K57_57145 [Burkholderiaceae bacterium]|nr:hypothetical protein [Burkholderiaceae bacterium]